MKQTSYPKYSSAGIKFKGNTRTLYDGNAVHRKINERTFKLQEEAMYAAEDFVPKGSKRKAKIKGQSPYTTLRSLDTSKAYVGSGLAGDQRFTLTTHNWTNDDAQPINSPIKPYGDGGRYRYKRSKQPGNRDKYEWLFRGYKVAAEQSDPSDVYKE